MSDDKSRRAVYGELRNEILARKSTYNSELEKLSNVGGRIGELKSLIKVCDEELAAMNAKCDSVKELPVASEDADPLP